MRHFKILFLNFAAFLLIFTVALFPGSSTRKEIRIFDTFEDYKIDKPFKVYHSEEQYNKDTAIKDDPTYIKQFKTIDDNDPTKNGREEIVPRFYLRQYYVFNDLDNPYKIKLKRLILLFDSVDALKKNVIVKMYKSDNCVSEMEQDINTRFKGGKNFIKIIYRYDQQTGNIWCQLHLVPNCHLEKYLDFKISQGKITTLQALKIKRNSDEEKYLWYDHNKKYMSMPGVKPKDQAGKKNAKNNSESSSRKNNTKRRSAFPNLPPPESAGVEAMNRYLIVQSYENSGIDLPPDYLLSPLDDPMLALANSLNGRRNNSFSPPGFKSPVSTPLPSPTRSTGLSMMPKPAPMGQDPSSISAVNPVISASSWAAMSGPSSKEITTEVNELNQYTRFDNWGLEYDLNGNTTRKGTQQYRYDYRGNVVIYEDLSTHAEYKYDALNRRTEKIVNGKVTKYYYSGYQVIEERDENDRVTKQYVYGNGIDEILQMKIYRGPYQGTYYYHTNANNSVTAVTDQEGNLIERVSYDVYGVPTFKEYITDPGNAVTRDYSIIGNEILWHSRRYDPESHTYYFRNRTYDPTMGRFLQTDPMGYKDSMNLYQAFGMNPVNFTDPYGLEPVKIYAGVVADIVNVMNNSPSKIGNRSGKQAIQALLYLGEAELIIKGVIPKVEPANTPYFNTKKGRYIYTKKGGWIDMSHFLFYAGRAYSYKIKIEKAKGIKKSSNFIQLPWYIRESISSTANMDPGGEALQEGFIQERMDSIIAPHSAYSYEDLPSDKFGIIFALNYFDPKSHLTLAKQISNFLNNVLGATVPTSAPNWNILPNKDTKDPPTQTNKTTTPIYTNEDIKKFKQFLKWLESFFK